MDFLPTINNPHRFRKLPWIFVVLCLLVLAAAARAGDQIFQQPTPVLPNGSPTPPVELPIPSDPFSFTGTKNILFLLDCSHSMGVSPPHARTKKPSIEVARSLIEQIVRLLPPDINCGIRVFGSTDTTVFDACRDTKLIWPISESSKRKEMLKSLGEVTPHGLSPIAYSLAKAFEDLQTTTEPSLIFLISDGSDTCNGNLMSCAQYLASSGKQIKIVAMSLDSERRLSKDDDRRRFAEVTGGKHYNLFLDGGTILLDDMRKQLKPIKK